MFPTHSFLQLAPVRVQRGVSRLREMIWRDALPLAVEATAATPEAVPFATVGKLRLGKVEAGSAWGRLYDSRWCRLRLDPVDLRKGRRWLHWQEEGEATLYVEGSPFFGFDVAHRCCELPDTVTEVWILSVCVQAAIWHPDARGISPQGSVFGGARVSHRDGEAWAAYHDLLCLAELMNEQRQLESPPLPGATGALRTQSPLLQASPFLRRLLRGLDQAIDELDTQGIPALRRRLARLTADLRQRRPLIHATLTGHSHLDLVWLWPERVGELKAVHTFANVNHLLGRYPEMRFAYSQPASYEAVGRREPGLARAVQRHIRAGRWEATGGMWVESDSHVACGEGLVRSFELGQEGFTRLRGRPSRLLWLPDLFGFNACLPQLMQLAGVEYFFTTKMTWNDINRFPHSSFIWRGLGGFEVIAHMTQEIGFNNTVSVAELRTGARSHVQSDLHPELLFPCGYGDGGGGPTDEMCERARRLSALGDLPGLSWGQPEAFFDRLAARRRDLPVHDGEIYLEAHRGVFTTHRRLKSLFRGLERALQVREAVACARGETPDLDHAWRRLVFAQFHDYIPGSSIPDVYLEGLPELESLARTLLGDAVSSLRGSEGAVPCWFNPLPIAREMVHQGRLFTLPPLAGVRVADAVSGSAVEPVVARGRSLDNGLVRVKVDARGHLAGLTVRGRRVALRPGAGGLMIFPDRPAQHEAWEIDRAALSLGQPVRGAAKITVEADAIVVRRRVGKHSLVLTRYALVPGSAVLRLTVELDWQEPHTLLKLLLPTDYHGTQVHCGLPFGSIGRSQQPGGSQDEALWEFPASRWVGVTDEDASGGLALVTESHYGFSCRDGCLAVSLVRSPLQVGFDGYSLAYPAGLSRKPRPASPFTDLGKHEMKFALAAMGPDTPQAEQPAVLAETLFTEPVAYDGGPIAPVLIGIENAPTLVPSWMRPLGRDRWLLRLHEATGSRGRATVRLADGWTATRAPLDGRAGGTALRGGALVYRPFEIITVVLTRAVRVRRR